MFNNIIRKIKNFYEVYFAKYVNKQDKSINPLFEYIMKHTIKIYNEDGGYFIIVELDDNTSYALWNANFIYGWLCIVYKFKNGNYENRKHIVGVEKVDTIYYEKQPTKFEIYKFKNWLEENYKFWEPHKDY